MADDKKLKKKVDIDIVKAQLKEVRSSLDPNQPAVWVFSVSVTRSELNKLNVVICNGMTTRKEVTDLLVAQSKIAIPKEPSITKILNPIFLGYGSQSNSEKLKKEKKGLKKANTIPEQTESQGQKIEKAVEIKNQYYRYKIKAEEHLKNVQIELDTLKIDCADYVLSLNREIALNKKIKKKYEELQSDYNKQKTINENLETQINSQPHRDSLNINTIEKKLSSEIKELIQSCLEKRSDNPKADIEIVEDRVTKITTLMVMIKDILLAMLGHSLKMDKAKNGTDWYTIRGACGGKYGDDGRVRFYFNTSLKKISLYYKKNGTDQAKFKNALNRFG